MDTSPSNPAGFYEASTYFSKLTGISKTYEIKLDSVRSKPKNFPNKLKKQKSKLLYASDAITVVDSSGNRHPYMSSNMRYDQRGIVADHFLVVQWTKLQDYGLTFIEAGTYKDSEGGGWYSKHSMLRYNDFYFCPSLS